MRRLSEAEMLSLSGLLKAENDGLAVSRAMESIIKDEDLKKQAEAGILEAEGRIKGLQQFINENSVIR
ncbi:ferritin-like metal-binding protein YciE [Clostridium acetobutylicum]|uniref:Uncharacterized protein n=1 Tax=Clostridium acetobutylicum (strain ATCC 824 / DSM 792 / JCM 1419 / IAM 19013 / LMG 5710 / NBRC 13948 / NRRL B-527 / VKM B-1787 / 2291 / W) TaxID=272562 RepID=Q97E02_CLOAB|nr:MULTISPECIES: hypothetical protein [Clostridium]AAK81250.1 Hypothetical protein CA_C3318 [Clostridium acetobutylicum ATCC 824]ADZ22358.1 Conserved hypothetical protein [Clostridium acetobutylicum EA 2018]AEI32766.1 hypothetical protein SMB_G3355 [Clostridium acetobutylicum DSM 1731]AWV81080.1 hypothetical protein DK921_13420 [Clostridium acetobutylicum]KHD36769.1 hypothetical protein NL50_09645 [Clostridium acetobutylicum]